MWIESLPPFIVENLDVFGLIVVGLLVEKKYISRPSIFANAIAVNLHAYKMGFPPDWLVYYSNGAVIFGGIAIATYVTGDSLSNDFYDLAMILYSSGVVGVIILFTV